MFESIAQSVQFLVGSRTFERFQQVCKMNHLFFYNIEAKRLNVPRKYGLITYRLTCWEANKRCHE